MRRAALEKSRTLQIWRNHLATHTEDLLCECEHQSGRFRKSQRIGGCGRPRCWLCHYDKLSGMPTLQEQRARINQIEGMKVWGKYLAAVKVDINNADRMTSAFSGSILNPQYLQFFL